MVLVSQRKLIRQKDLDGDNESIQMIMKIMIPTINIQMISFALVTTILMADLDEKKLRLKLPIDRSGLPHRSPKYSMQLIVHRSRGWATKRACCLFTDNNEEINTFPMLCYSLETQIS